MKNNTIQSWRGVAIIAVMLIHTNFLAFDETTRLITRPLLNFAVPLFFFFSGYFAKFEEKVNWKAVKRIGIPYLIWSLINYSLNLYFSHKHGNMDYAEQYSLWELILFGRSCTQMYYLVVLLEMILLTPVIYRFRNSAWCKWLCLAATPLSILVLHFNMVSEFIDPVWIVDTFWGWLTFYYMGIQYKESKGMGAPHRLSTLLLTAFVCLYLNFTEIDILSGISENYNIFLGPLNLASFCFTLIVFTFVKMDIQQNRENAFKTSVLSKIGDCSFFLYLSHIQLFRGGYVISDLLTLSSMDTLSSLIVKNGVIILFTLAVGCGLVWLGERFLPSRLVKWLGVK
jgi:surface polysaccharide O-acyltransferase-like enzyme